MVEAAAEPTRGMHPLLYHVRESLLQLTPAARRRAAQSRILLVDLRFQDVGFWMAIAAPSRRPAVRNRPHACFPRRSAADLSRSTLTLAWHALLASPDIARLALGMHREVASIITELRMSELERVAKKGFEELTPRWPDFGSVWGALLQAARDNDAHGIKLVTLHTLQLAAADGHAQRP